MGTSSSSSAARFAESLAPFAEMALASIHREYPYHLTLVLTEPGALALPRAATPAFFGSFDWHSAVHGHWCLVRALRLAPDAPYAPRARAALGVTLSEATLAAEARFVASPGREGFERPYGLAWVLQLAAECAGWDDPDARRWRSWLAPLEALASERLLGWLARLPYPIRSGEHSQSAFALGLLHDWAAATGADNALADVRAGVRRLYGADRAAPLAYEPSAHDFLSPLIAEADLLRRALEPAEFAAWLEGFLPAAGAPELARWLTPVRTPDGADGKFAHLDGLNLSRAWMLEGIVAALPVGHAYRDGLAAAATAHRSAGLAGARNPHYAGSHWLGSFAVYLLTGRGLG